MKKGQKNEKLDKILFDDEIVKFKRFKDKKKYTFGNIKKKWKI